jgi:hypothetical protein
VNADCKTYRLQIDSDPRLAAAAGGLARFIGEAAGLPSESATELQKSAIAACTEAFEGLGVEHGHVTVILNWLTDRIEIAVSQEGSAPAVGLDRIAGFADQIGSTAALSGIDRVQYEAREGVAVTRLIKYLGPVPRTA